MSKDLDSSLGPGVIDLRMASLQSIQPRKLSLLSI